MVLEPDEPLRTARRAFYAGMVALADALRAYAPPESRSTIDWPDAIRVDGGLVGGGRLGWPVIRERGRAAALAGVRRHDPHGLDDRERAGRASARLGAGAGRVWRGRRGSGDGELCAASDGRTSTPGRPTGFDAVAREYLQRLPREAAYQRGIDENGDLLVRRDRQRTRSSGCESDAGAGRAVLARFRNAEGRGYEAACAPSRSIHPTRSCSTCAAEPGEWAVSGAFRFWNAIPPTLEGKARSAFRSGFLGVESLGLVDAGADRRARPRSDRRTLVELLAQQLVERFGAPDLASARARGGRGSRLRAIAVQSSDRTR